LQKGFDPIPANPAPVYCCFFKNPYCHYRITQWRWSIASYRRFLSFLADCGAYCSRSVIGYWHDIVVCPYVRLSGRL